MPGLSAVRGDGLAANAASRALDATVAFEHYEAGPALEREEVVVGRTSYDGYPIRRVETDHGTAFLEGCLYGVDDVDEHVERVAALVADRDVEALGEWVGSRDGEFLFLLVGQDDVAVLNDQFGRLPAYYATVDGAAVCSRELAFVREYASVREEPVTLDRLTAAQFCCFGYPLGTRTLFEGVRAMPPGSLAVLGDDVAVESIHELDFDACRHADRSVEENADELADRIVAACRRRAAPERPTVVSLSGGLDSRTVAAAYEAAGAPASAASFRHDDGRNEDEVAAAGAVAERLGLDWTVYDVAESPDLRRTLLETKQGMNFLGMAFVLDFFEQLRERRGTVTCATGDGGDKLLVGLEPSKRPVSEAALVEHAIDANSRMSVDEAAAIAGIDPEELRASVAERVHACPESDLARQYVHFLVRERGINFLVQGEDRNRYYAWSTSPFYAPSVFEYAMNCPDEQKDYRRLQRAILERFDSALVDVTYPNYGAAITSRRYRAKQFVYDALERYPGVRKRIVDLVSSDDGSSERVVRAIRADLPAVEWTGLSRTRVADVLAAPEDYSAIQLYSLSTVTALASSIASERTGSPADVAGEPADGGDEASPEPTAVAARHDEADPEKTPPER